MLPSSPERVVIAAIVVIVEGPIATAHLVTRYANATVAALDEPAQEPVIWFRAPRAPLGVVIADALRSLEEFLVEDHGNWYGDPLVTGAPYLALCLCAVAVQNGGSAIVVCAAHVSLVAYRTSDHRYAPDGLPAWRRNKVLVELPGDLSHREIALDIVSKDAAYDHRLGFVDLEVRGSLGRARNASISIRAFPRDHLAGTRAPQLAAVISLCDLRALVFSYHALYLSEQLGLRVVGKRRGVVEQHRDAMVRQFVEHNDLIGIHTG